MLHVMHIFNRIVGGSIRCKDQHPTLDVPQHGRNASHVVVPGTVKDHDGSCAQQQGCKRADRAYQGEPGMEGTEGGPGIWTKTGIRM